MFLKNVRTLFIFPRIVRKVIHIVDFTLLPFLRFLQEFKIGSILKISLVI